MYLEFKPWKLESHHQCLLKWNLESFHHGVSLEHCFLLLFATRGKKQVNKMIFLVLHSTLPRNNHKTVFKIMTVSAFFYLCILTAVFLFPMNARSKNCIFTWYFLEINFLFIILQYWNFQK